MGERDPTKIVCRNQPVSCGAFRSYHDQYLRSGGLKIEGFWELRFRRPIGPRKPMATAS
jgi:hypothetical protein